MAKIAGFVLRCADKKITADFYTKLGLNAVKHEHGGPLHFQLEPLADKETELVVELYNLSSQYAKDAIMLYVDSIPKALAMARDFGIEPKTEVKEAKNFVHVYITDPDGRDVMLIQDQKPDQPKD
ncbi:MAG: hypothetical protein G01um101413_639 [Parcubacteria group bacterium Gr01-1014_13]|nr:MAG: hypothetical protein G01um101413_639 [Parcubacteria group bacterium Gr01-1014_13]